jgi:hypothetical protein
MEYVFRVAIKTEELLNVDEITTKILDGVYNELEGEISFREISARPLNEEE